MKKKIVILGGSLNSANRGVNALTRGTINMIYNSYKNIEVVLLSNSVEKDVKNLVRIGNDEVIIEEIFFKNKKILKILLSPKVEVIKNIILNEREKSISNLINEVDLVLDLSGGDSFSDIYGYKRFIENVLMKKITLKYNKKLILLPQTIGPFNNKIVAKVAQNIINKSTKTYARDILSYDIVTNNLKVSKEKVELTPDMAFWLESSNKEIIKFDKEKSIYIGINISGLLINGGYNNSNMFNFKTDYKKLMKEIVYLLQKKENVKLIFIPHVVPDNLPVEDDILASNNLIKEMNATNNKNILIINEKLKEDELKGIIKKCDFFIGGRMHACIGAISSGVPTVPIAYSRKFLGIWKKFGLDDSVVDPRNEELEKIINKINKNYELRNDIKNQLEVKMKYIKTEYTDLQNEIDKIFN